MSKSEGVYQNLEAKISSHLSVLCTLLTVGGGWPHMMRLCQKDRVFTLI